MWTRQLVKFNAKASLKANYWKSVLVSMLLMTVTMTATRAAGAATGSKAANTGVTKQMQDYFASLTTEQQQEVAIAIITAVTVITGMLILFGIIALVVDVFIFNPLMVGIRKFSLDSVREGENGEVADLGQGFDLGYMSNVKAMFFTDLFIFLWSLLLVVPGIIKMYQYRMVSFILIENPGMDYKEVQARSKLMMYGNKWKTFVLDLSFIGWDILNGITFGILGIFYVGPYKMLTDAALYDVLSRNLEKVEAEMPKSVTEGTVVVGE